MHRIVWRAEEFAKISLDMGERKIFAHPEKLVRFAVLTKRAHFRCNLIEYLFPRNLLPVRIGAWRFVFVATLQWPLHPIGIIQLHDSGVSLWANRPAFCAAVLFGVAVEKVG